MVFSRLKRRQKDEDDVLDKMTQIFKALSDKSRLKILEVLESGKRYGVTELAEKVGLERTNVSHHLSKLSDMGFVSHVREGKMVYHFLTDKCVRDIMRRARDHVTS